MRDKLIELAKECGFTSNIIGKSVNSLYSSKDFYYLWLCELHKWCREIQHLDVFVCDSIKENHYDWYIYCHNKESKIEECEQYYQQYLGALEDGLFKACTMIKETH